jgi:hypothetical protein
LGDGVEPAVHHLADAAEVRGHVDDRRVIREVPVKKNTTSVQLPILHAKE